MTAAVRVRFAPSPTGWLHVGGARTAYFNWLFARQHSGVFVLRIEDTDLDRSSAESERGVLDDLRWLGLEWDEGPDRGGALGPYRQSERLDLYRRRATELLQRGAAYPCFCRDDELEERRAAALAAGRPPHYDGRCRKLTDAERDERRREGRPESVRFAAPPRDQVLNDLVRGEVTFPSGMVGDFILLRASGLPTYNFACVVDDSAMKISHVIRAEEHLSNTARQLMLYQALEEPAPEFAHVALILNPDRTKMSKRGGEASVAVGDWRKAGYLPEALLSYLALLGFHPGDDREVLSREELLQSFTLDRVGRSGSVFDAAKLRWMNAHYLHAMSGADLRRAGAAFLPEAAGSVGPDHLERLLEAVRTDLGTLADLPHALEPFLAGDVRFEPDARALIDSESARRVCATLSSEIGPLDDWRAEVFKSAVQSVGKRLGLKGRDLYQPVRIALTGRTHGPELPIVAELLGKNLCATRLHLVSS
ncbi:MAG TPA: glutamate--tRNA ligase [Candidatus Udaeobacter sp.]|jgi:glutamyl-tRNA synthetase|nr:glutamate--tRNA ligase [Candidatus Udaeobacter sp.]